MRVLGVVVVPRGVIIVSVGLWYVFGFVLHGWWFVGFRWTMVVCGGAVVVVGVVVGG